MNEGDYDEAAATAPWLSAVDTTSSLIYESGYLTRVVGWSYKFCREIRLSDNRLQCLPRSHAVVVYGRHGAVASTWFLCFNME